MTLFQIIPAPSQWLDEVRQRLGLSQARLAHILGRDPAQVNRWLKEREQVPTECLVEIASLAGSWNEVSYVNNLKSCEGLGLELIKECEYLASGLAIDREVISGRLFPLIEELAVKIAAATPGERVAVLTKYVADGLFAVRQARKALCTSEPIISPETIGRHLRYPVNIILGTLLEMDVWVPKSADTGGRIADFREANLENLRQSADMVRPRSHFEELSKQHAVHLLARYGEDDDENRAESLISLADLPMRRMAYFGLALGRKDDEVIDRFQHELQHNSELSTYVIAFDAVHYGDTALEPNGELSPNARQVDHSVVHVLRHLEEEVHRGLRGLNLFKLVEMLRAQGVEPFFAPSVRERLQKIAAMLPDTGRTGMENRFLLEFKEVIAAEGVNGIPN